MRDDLRELARLATIERSSSLSPAPLAFESADSSGYVDLSAYSASDPQWVEREIARACGRPRAIDALAPASMAPVSLEALVASDDGDTVTSARRRRRLIAVSVLGVGLCAAIVALAAIQGTLPLPGIGTHATAAHAAAPAPVPAPSPVPPAQPARTVTAAESRAPETATAATLPTASALAEAPNGTAHPTAPSRKRSHGVGHAHLSAPHLAPSGAHSAPARAAPPATHKAGSDSLMDLIRQSVNSDH